jgi:subtilase family serine protease
VSTVPGDTNEANNCLAAAKTIQVLGQPDLVVTQAAPLVAGVKPGLKLGVSDTVLNQGGSAAVASKTRYYLVKDLVRTELKGNRQVPGLDPGTESAGQASVTVPAGMAPGSYGLQACADDTKLNKESDETNNCTLAAAPVQVLGFADLVVAALSDPPPTLAPGDQLSITDTVLNQGSEPAGASTLRYYMSVDQVKNKGDFSLKNDRLIDPLAGGEASTATTPITLRKDTVPGTYYLLACADELKAVAEGDEGNNCRASTTQVVVGGLPDLVVTSVGNPPPTGKPGDEFIVTDTVNNIGVGEAGPSTVQYYLSTDELRNSDERIKGVRQLDTVPAGEASTGPATLKIQAGTPPGTYFLLACADDLKAVTEASEKNNCAASATTLVIASAPDLVVTSVSDPPVSAQRGEQFVVSDTVRNQGGGDAPQTTTRYYLSLDGSKNSGDKRLKGVGGIGLLAPDTEAGEDALVTIPTDTVAGTYLLLACADDTDLVTEAVENNNCRASAGTITVDP